MAKVATEARERARWGLPGCDTYTDGDAFSEFYTEYFPKAVSKVIAHFAVPDEEAQDLVQDAFLSFWQQSATFCGEYTALCAFFWRTVRFRVTSYWGRRLRRQKDTQSLHDLLARDTSGAELERIPALRSTYNVERQVMARLDLQMAGAALQRLTPAARRMALLDLQGYSYADMMQQCGIAGWVTFDNRLQRVRKQVRRETRYGRAERQWSRHHSACIACGTTERRHVGSGYCERCAKQRQLQRRAGREAHDRAASVQVAACADCYSTAPGIRIKERCQGCYDRWHAKHRHHAAPVQEPIAKTWARQHTACQQCGTVDIPHLSRGLCRRCYRQTFFPKKKAVALS